MDPNRFRTRTLQDERVLRILAAAVNAVEPGKLVQDYLMDTVLPAHKRIFLLGIGKAAEAMTFAAADVLTGFAHALIVTKHASFPGRQRVTVLEAGHPVPDSRSLAAGQAALDFASQLDEEDLLICLISGGGSALVTAPKAGITLEEIRSQTKKLLADGATIHEINSLRKQLDRIKGGGLARATKAKVVGLILSDVIGNSFETISSGPTAERSLGNRVQNFMVGDIRVAAEAAKIQALKEGFDSEILDLQVEGEASEVGLRFAQKLNAESGRRRSPFCLIAGGETTVAIKGNGTGGRNQEAALSAVDELSGLEGVLFIALATDGEDGPTVAAGAAVNGKSRLRAAGLGMFAADHLSRNDSYHFFRALDDLVQCGYSGTNVNDLLFLIRL